MGLMCAEEISGVKIRVERDYAEVIAWNVK